MKNIVLSLVTFFLIYFLFVAGSLPLSRLNNTSFLALIFGLFSYGSVYLFLSEKIHTSSPASHPGKIAGIMISGIIIGTLIIVAVAFAARIKKSNDDAAYRQNSQKYSAAVSTIVGNTEMGSPVFAVVPDESNGAPELLIEFPLSVSEAAKNTGVKKLRNDAEFEFRFGFSFSPMEPFDFKQAENSADLYPCRRGNTTIRFADPRKAFVNELVLTDPDPRLFVSIYLYGDDCTPEILAQNLKNKTLYVYRREVSEGNDRPLYKSFSVDSVGL